MTELSIFFTRRRPASWLEQTIAEPGDSATIHRLPAQAGFDLRRIGDRLFGDCSVLANFLGNVCR